jgi:hypothetical protein
MGVMSFRGAVRIRTEVIRPRRGLHIAIARAEPVVSRVMSGSAELRLELEPQPVTVVRLPKGR